MASPDVFRSPSSWAPQRELRTSSSSSPDFPSLNDIVATNPVRPPFHTPSKKTSAPNSHFIAAGAGAEQLDDIKDISVISLPSTDEERSRQAPTKRKTVRKKAAPRSKYFTGDQPWKKYKSPPKSGTHDGDAQREDDGQASPSASSMREVAPAPEQDASLIVLEDDHLASGQSKPRSKTREPDAPLHLELAPGRRADWTPPSKKDSGLVDLRSDPALKDPNVSTQVDDSGIFKNLLQTYGCDVPLPEPATFSEEDSSFLKKRKLIELVTPADGGQSPPLSPDKSRPKQKAATKKKPRTITELATAAYQPPAAVEATDPTQAQLPFHQNEIVQSAEASSKGKGKGKAKAKAKPVRKSKATTKSKKKVELLLSPGTALKQSAAQDFVFGTSSQLVREQSPTLLRDIQIAMRNSNIEAAEVEADPFLDSDDRPVVKKPSLWAAAARDDDGGLLDIELVDLADRSSPPGLMDESGDPFGYSKPDDVADLPECLGGRESNASFETLSDLLPSKTRAPDIDEKSEFSLSDISVSTDVRKTDLPSVIPPTSAELATETTTELESNTSAIPIVEGLERPKFELCTDAQLARQIKGYGFKAVKRRSAMISLLEQCWRSKHGAAGGAVRTFATSSTVSQPRKDTPATPVELPSPKAARGRPRKSPSKTLSSPVAIQEPPPSAQPVESPKRPRGRPKKVKTATEATDEAVASVSPKKGRGRPTKKTTTGDDAAAAKTTRKPRLSKTTTKTPKKTASAPSTPVKKRSSKLQGVLEIPDSASDQDSDGSVLSSSPEPTFSPPAGIDMSVSMEEGEDASLLPLGSPGAQQSSIFERITEAVTTAPWSTDPANPSWHEKMLMYDPIILEDLASWLNSGQLSRVGHDDEVSPIDVKKWCESQSVCCLWRLNMRGASRKRY